MYMNASIPSLGTGIKVLSPSESIDLDLGPLADLKGTWIGKPFDGWNVIAVPGPQVTQGFTLEVIPYEETLTFTPVVVAGNRGPVVDGVQEDQQLIGLLYEQTIKSVCTSDLCVKMGFGAGNEIHAERGILLNITNFNSAPDPNNPSAPVTELNIARLATVPHGNSILALGTAITGVPPDHDFFGKAFIKPSTVDGSRILPGYEETQYNKQQFADKGFNQTDPNLFLQSTLGAAQLTSLIELKLSTKNGTGGILNIPFIQKNVDATDMHCSFWIERLRSPVVGGPDILQLQYSQTINLVFPATGSKQMIIWPHVTVNTLRKEK